MNVRLKLTDEQDAHIIKNLWPLYQHDVSEFDASKPNRHGLFGADDSVETLAQHAESVSAWWSDESALFPYLILADGSAAGFCLIAGRPRIPDTIPADFVVQEFFLLHAYRGKGVAAIAVTRGFDSHKGRWEVVTYSAQTGVIAFWQKVIRRYSAAGISESEMDHPWGRKVVFRFDNTSGKLDAQPGANE